LEKLITLDTSNIDQEHICCAFSDKKCAESYQQKKDWLKREFENGYVFRRIDARAKVFMEYGPAEKGWAPVSAPNYLLVNCFWVSGKYKGQGYGRELLRLALEDAKAQGKDGLVTIVGTQKYHFMSDTKWLLRQGFESVEETSDGFSLLVLKLKKEGADPKFKPSVHSGPAEHKEGLLAYYTNRCPFSEYHVHNSLRESAEKRKIPLHIVKLDSLEEAQSAPTPATIFSLYYNGRFITTDISVCMDSRFDKFISIE
jgi:GNAT superfamily N-acetyltransferase